MRIRKGNKEVERMERNEILMILQPRAIPEAIDSLNKLDIEKVWFRGYDEPSVCKALNEFVRQTDYDYYWVIADDVIVDNLPLQVLRPMLDKYEVVSGYCKWYEDCDYVNLLHSPIQCVYGGEHETYGFLKQLNRAIPSRNAWINRIPPKKPEGEEVWDFMFYDMWHEQSCFKMEEIEDRENPEIETYFSGWSFTGASRKIWLNYPFECSVMDCQSDIQFSIRYVNRDGGIIHSHKDAYFIHLKKNTDILMSEWLVGVEAPITYLGKGKIHREDIGVENIWDDVSEEFLPSTNPDIHSGKTRLTDL